MGAFKLEKNFCPKVGHAVSTIGVCERRSMAVMAPAWPLCVGCDFREVLVDPEGRLNMTTMADPPPQWFNMDRYVTLLGEETCRGARGSSPAAELGEGTP